VRVLDLVIQLRGACGRERFYPRKKFFLTTMNEERFVELLRQAHRGEAPVVLAAVELEPGLATRAAYGGGHTILHGASRGGHADLVRDLLDRQADLHQRSTVGQDSLMYASCNGHIPVIELLLSRGADIAARNVRGNTALWLAATHHQMPTCQFLISRGSDPMAVNNQGESVMDIFR